MKNVRARSGHQGPHNLIFRVTKVVNVLTGAKFSSCFIFKIIIFIIFVELITIVVVVTWH